MTETTTAPELIEQAENESRFCTACGARNLVVADDQGAVWLQCGFLGQSRSGLRRLFGLQNLARHTRRLVVASPGSDEFA
jgi:hypothetical protein